MLVLSRNPMERIHIGDNVVVTVRAIKGNKVRIGIDAPKEVHVLRAELLDRVSKPPADDFFQSVVPTQSPMLGGIGSSKTEEGNGRVQRLQPSSPSTHAR